MAEQHVKAGRAGKGYRHVGNRGLTAKQRLAELRLRQQLKRELKGETMNNTPRCGFDDVGLNFEGKPECRVCGKLMGIEWWLSLLAAFPKGSRLPLPCAQSRNPNRSGWRCRSCNSSGAGTPAKRDGVDVCPLCLSNSLTD